MKRLLILGIVILGFASLALGEPPVRQVEVVNEYLDISQPVDVNVVNQPGPVQYEYYAFEGEGPNMLNVLNLLKPGQNEYWTIPDLLNQKSSEGFGLYSFIVSGGGSWLQHYIVIMRRPVP